jgi:hypothetical protein
MDGRLLSLRLIRRVMMASSRPLLNCSIRSSNSLYAFIMMIALLMSIESSCRVSVMKFYQIPSPHCSPATLFCIVIDPASTSTLTRAFQSVLKSSCMEAFSAKALPSINLIARVLASSGIVYMISHAPISRQLPPHIQI